MSVLSNLEGSTLEMSALKHNFHHQIFDSKSRHHLFLEFQALGFEGKQPFKSWYACSISCLSSRIFLACNRKKLDSKLEKNHRIHRQRKNGVQSKNCPEGNISDISWYLQLSSGHSWDLRQDLWIFLVFGIPHLHQFLSPILLLLLFSPKILAPSLASGQKVREWTTTKIIQQKMPTFYDSLLFFWFSFYFSLCLGIRLQMPTSFTIFSIQYIIYTSVFESKESSSKMSPSSSQTWKRKEIYIYMMFPKKFTIKPTTTRFLLYHPFTNLSPPIIDGHSHTIHGHSWRASRRSSNSWASRFLWVCSRNISCQTQWSAVHPDGMGYDTETNTPDRY